MNNGIPFELKRKGIVELDDEYGSYICENGHIHDYSKINLKEIEKEAKNNKTYNNAEEMINDILKQWLNPLSVNPRLGGSGVK